MAAGSAARAGEMRVYRQRVENRRLFVQMIVIVGDDANIRRQHRKRARMNGRLRIDFRLLHGGNARRIHPDLDNQGPADKGEYGRQHQRGSSIVVRMFFELDTGDGAAVNFVRPVSKAQGANA